ncbi:hypothetical protein [Leptospirillum ferriphilum]|uniref:hypothetical protein n=1 Tax=Leptospirillum ferriphilum TaxID=178606 RepID=UPI0006B1910B|nr:hypothetical protein [Leptospirillum ferriphilum]
MKRLAGAVLIPILLAGCTLPETDQDLSDITPQVFESLPGPTGTGSLCGTPLPVPSTSLVVQTVRTLAGSAGRVRVVPLPSGYAVAVWTNEARARSIRRYMSSLFLRNTIRITAILTRKDRQTPLFRRSFSVREGTPFLAGRWQEGDRTVGIYGFFTILGPHAFPVLDLEEGGIGWSECRTLTKTSSGIDRASIRKGTETFTLSWETLDAKK